jgi:hypothetical protein
MKSRGGQLKISEVSYAYEHFIPSVAPMAVKPKENM